MIDTLHSWGLLGPGPMVVALVVATIFYVSVKQPAYELIEVEIDAD